MADHHGIDTDQTAHPGWGVFWMIVTGILFVGVTALVKYLGTRVPAPQAAFLRYAMGLVFVLPLLRTMWAFRPERRTWGLIAARGAFHTAGVALWFYAMARIPIADVTAMNYLSPIYVTLGAALFLGERLAARRVIAVIVALCGAVIILRPGFRELGPGHIGMLFTAIFFGGSYLLAKLISGRVSAGVVVAMPSPTAVPSSTPGPSSPW